MESWVGMEGGSLPGTDLNPQEMAAESCDGLWDGIYFPLEMTVISTTLNEDSSRCSRCCPQTGWCPQHLLSWAQGLPSQSLLPPQ